VCYNPLLLRESPRSLKCFSPSAGPQAGPSGFSKAGTRKEPQVKKIPTILAILISLSLILTACGGGIPVVDFDKPLIEWPEICDVTTNECFKVVISEKVVGEGSMPGTQYVYEYFPVSPLLSEQETVDNLAAIGYAPDDQVIMMVLPSTWLKEDGTAIDITMAGGAAIATMAKSDPRLCTAIGMHVIDKIGQISWPVMLAAFDALGNGTITPDVIRTGGGKTVVQFVYEGVKWLLVFADTSSPTVIVPVVGNVLGKFAGATKALPALGTGQALGVMAEVSYFFKCVKNSWPKNRSEAEKARRDHNSAYDQRKVETVPDDFPMPFPVLGSDGQVSTVMIQVSAGDFSNMLALELDILIGLGVVILVVTTPLPEIAFAGGGAASLQWATQFAH